MIKKGWYVYYMVMEGDNYAGGWGERKAEISELWQVKNYEKVKKVVPFVCETFDEVSKEEYSLAIENYKNDQVRIAKEVKEEKIKKLERELNLLKNSDK